MFQQILAAFLGNVSSIASNIDNAVTEYRADQNNAQKAHTVAKGVLGLVDAIAPLLTLIK